MNEKDTCGQAPQSSNAGQAVLSQYGRQSAKLVLQDILHRLKRKQSHIESLLGMLPTQMTQEQDEAMWHLAWELERR